MDEETYYIKDRLTYRVRGAIFEVHKHLGPGLFEECYHQALLRELELNDIEAESKVKIPVKYKGIEIKDAYEADIIVEDELIIELKSVDKLSNVHFRQLQTYLHLKNLHVGYLVNFNCLYMKDNVDIIKVYNNEATDKSDI